MCGLFHLSSRGDPSCGSLSYRMSASKSLTSVTADNNVIINHIGWLFTFCWLVLLVDSRKTFFPSLLFPSLSFLFPDEKTGNLCVSKPLSIIPVLVLHCWEGGSVYHTVCSRRLDKDFTSYIPYDRYISMCACVCVFVEYVNVNIWGFIFGCIEDTVHSIRDHS